MNVNQICNQFKNMKYQNKEYIKMNTPNANSSD